MNDEIAKKILEELKTMNNKLVRIGDRLDR